MLLDSYQHNRAKGINITPLIDVVFILLLFFMLSSTFSRFYQTEINAAVSGSTSLEETKVKRLLLRKNNLLLDGVSFNLDSDLLVRRLKKIQSSEVKVIVAAVANVEVQQLIEFVDQLAQLGITDINIAQSVPVNNAI